MKPFDPSELIGRPVFIEKVQRGHVVGCRKVVYISDDGTKNLGKDFILFFSCQCKRLAHESRMRTMFVAFDDVTVESDDTGSARIFLDRKKRLCTYITQQEILAICS